ncbi:MAG: heme-binding domain-containing protein [Cyclobacteriaceae bacterium]|jgi:hypothetical protein|nr:heme-binding domain-containing protein [Cyclobacteriaceae bacterium]
MNIFPNTMLKKIVLIVALLLAVLQFIRPPKNQAEENQPNDIANVYRTPEEVQVVLVQKCYDCHSNNTVYPWYSNIQPVGWFLYDHIREGKGHLNFSEFATYSEKRKLDKLEEISEAVTEGWMPLDSYLWMHPHSRITPADSELINSWLQSLGVSGESESSAQ